MFSVKLSNGGNSVFFGILFSSISRLLKVLLMIPKANLDFILFLERACRLIVTPKKGMQDFR